jgi:hypothetical protein
MSVPRPRDQSQVRQLFFSLVLGLMAGGVLVVPDPATLEVGKLDEPLVDTVEQFVQRGFVGLEGAGD